MKKVEVNLLPELGIQTADELMRILETGKNARIQLTIKSEDGSQQFNISLSQEEIQEMLNDILKVSVSHKNALIQSFSLT